MPAKNNQRYVDRKIQQAGDVALHNVRSAGQRSTHPEENGALFSPCPINHMLIR